MERQLTDIIQIRLWIIAVVHVTCALSIYGQLHCINYTAQDGLPADNVLCAVEDHDGFMWFGTGNGLCRFDGLTFDYFENDNQESSPKGAYVKAIAVDESNNIWAGTETQGIFHFNRKQNIWTRYHTNAENGFNIPGNEVFFIHPTAEGKVWYGCNNGGLGFLEPRTGLSKNYALNDLPNRGTWNNRVLDLVSSLKDANIFYLLGNGFLFEFNAKTEKFTQLDTNNTPTNEPEFNFIPTSLAQDSKGNFWMGSWSSGVKYFKTKQGLYEDIYPDTNFLKGQWRTNVFMKSNDEIWATFRQDGIVKWDQKNEKWSVFRSEPYDRMGLLKGEYNAIYHTIHGDSWVLTSKGISLIVPSYQAFSYYENNLPKTNFFLDILKLPDHLGYIAAFAGENYPLKIYDSKFNLQQQAYFKKDPTNFQSVFKILTHEDYIFCLAGNLFTYDISKNKLIPFPFTDVRITEDISDFLIDAESNLWLLVQNGSLIKYNLKTKKHLEIEFDGYDQKSRDQRSLYSMTLVGKEIWIAAKTELIRYGITTQSLQYYFLEKDTLIQRIQNESIASISGSIEQIITLNDSVAWILNSEDGLFLIGKALQEDKLEVLDSRNKKYLSQLQSPVEMIHGANNDFWIATKNGLVYSNYNLSKFKVFNQREGLSSSKLTQGISRIENDLFIGMPKGFSKVNTEILTRAERKATCHILSAEIDNVDFSNNKANDFSYDQNNLSVKVSAPIYDEANEVEYVHRLRGLHNNWKYTRSIERVFDYENLPHGKYTFEVKAKSPSTTWSDVCELEFKIKAPFWRTAWFRTIALLASLGVIYLIYQLKLNRDLKEEKVKTKLAELENQALRAQMNPHFIFNSLNSIKSLILLDRKKEGITYLTKFSRMVREILNLSKEVAIPLEKEIELLEIYLDMESLRFHQKFEYHINIDSSVNVYKQKVPPLLIQPFVENSIWHGLLHKEGDAHLEVNLIIKESFLLIQIVDDGIGRSASESIKSNKSAYRKTSQGLSLSKKRIDLADEFAKIEIEDLIMNGKPSGTSVTIKLPIDYGSKN